MAADEVAEAEANHTQAEAATVSPAVVIREAGTPAVVVIPEEGNPIRAVAVIRAVGKLTRAVAAIREAAKLTRAATAEITAAAKLTLMATAEITAAAAVTGAAKTTRVAGVGIMAATAIAAAVVMALAADTAADAAMAVETASTPGVFTLDAAIITVDVSGPAPIMASGLEFPSVTDTIRPGAAAIMTATAIGFRPLAMSMTTTTGIDN